MKIKIQNDKLCIKKSWIQYIYISKKSTNMRILNKDSNKVTLTETINEVYEETIIK